MLRILGIVAAGIAAILIDRFVVSLPPPPVWFGSWLSVIILGNAVLVLVSPKARRTFTKEWLSDVREIRQTIRA